jgi:L-alanine-DL-glutamate epimerase-like enolase superfamily enzyme
MSVVKEGIRSCARAALRCSIPSLIVISAFPANPSSSGFAKQLAGAVDVPLLVGETTEGAHFNMADFIHSGAATYVRTSAQFKGGVTGALRIAHLAEAYLLKAEVHGMGVVNRHLCMAIPNTSYYEALVWGNPIETAPEVDSAGRVHAPEAPGIGWGEAADDRPRRATAR